MTRSRHDKPVEEWLRQSEYDLETAELLLENERYPYAVYFAHLAVEKALKGLYRDRFEENPPVTHNLSYLADRTKLVVPDDLQPHIENLNRASILNLYPDRVFGEDLEFDADAARKALNQTRELMDWITDHFE